MLSIIHFLVLTCCLTTSVWAAMQCYQCSTATKPDCADLSQTNNLDKCKTTTGSEINCLKYTYKINGKQITYRGCRQKVDTCEDVKNAVLMEKKEFLDCKLCDTDFCGKDESGPVDPGDGNHSTALVGGVAFVVMCVTSMLFIV